MSNFDLVGRFGVITGGLGPLGWSLTRDLAEAGARVLAVDLPGLVSQPIEDDVPSGVETMACDLLNPEHLNELLARVEQEAGGLGFLINNAAFTGGSGLTGYACDFEEQTDEAFDLALALNLAAPFRLARRMAPALRRSRYGAIVNVSSIYGLVGPDLGSMRAHQWETLLATPQSKGGLVQLTRYLATVLAPEIRVNCVCPGGIARDQAAPFVQKYESRTPLGRMATEDDITGTIRWLVSGAASYVTGQIIAVDGGWTAW